MTPETTACQKFVGPGEAFDNKGVPIYPGDLLKTFHFAEPRGRKHWLYHTAINVDGKMRMVPTSKLEPTKVNQGGSCWILTTSPDLEIISGYGPGKCLDHHDRPRRKVDE